MDADLPRMGCSQGLRSASLPMSMRPPEPGGIGEAFIEGVADDRRGRQQDAILEHVPAGGGRDDGPAGMVQHRGDGGAVAPSGESIRVANLTRILQSTKRHVTLLWMCVPVK